MTSRFSAFPTSLRERTRTVRLGPRGAVPALFIHPDDVTPAPVLLWMHGRSVSKEIDTARYLRLIRAGIAVLAPDLPGHGARLDPELQAPAALPRLLELALSEVDAVVDSLLEADYGLLARPDRLAIGGMSAGGMVALRRLCDPHRFRCVTVEATCGDFARAAGQDRFVEARGRGLDPMGCLDGWTPLPLLAVHSEADEVVPVDAMRSFTSALAARYREAGADPGLVRLATFEQTGAPQEHLGFGRRARDARALQVEFLTEHLLA